MDDSKLTSQHLKFAFNYVPLFIIGFKSGKTCLKQVPR